MNRPEIIVLHPFLLDLLQFEFSVAPDLQLHDLELMSCHKFETIPA